MDLIVKEKNEVSVRRRKKREKENRKSIFEIYRSEKTMKDYFFYLNDFLLFVYDNGEPIQNDEVLELMSDITEEDVEDYLSHLLYERKLKKTSVNKIMSALKSLYKELEKYNVLNPLKHIKLFKTSRNLDNILKVSYEDIKNILANYKVSGEKEYRNTIIMYTLFYTGMRSQELLNVRYKNILKRDNDYFIKIEKSKSGKELYKPLHNILVEKLLEFKNYIMNMYGYSEEELEERYVFSSSYEKNSQLSYKALYNIIQDMGKVIGLNISPHNIRHAIATELSSNGADLIEIRDFLGHSDTKVTEIYINAKSLLDKKVISKIPD
ncbi:tyrosine-type recombinase/integrase [Fusobacterium perfoetens]|uniref:tyrosine-type recombinase/integrase n=1 Tax=Fusobacterium perfoetens TaxID=852 RepID=UPI000484A263|nr:tyrosine-type recombinase/integrase [Fusobacterium perfoetens]MCI6152032.1 tyrosine-type recombinase/integrase [Fusobacterium perfoetens]MDY3238077.1 tyrosine-type recombinase/integrase [Fusobacterium perfoetens]